MIRYFSATVNILSNVGTPLERPYKWASTTECLPMNLYNELAATRPLPPKTKESNKRVDLRATEALKMPLSDIWRDFIEYHTSASFYHFLAEKFDLERAKTVAIRGAGIPADIYMDCQIGINTPVKEESTVGGPHLDGKDELWAAMLYMREEDDNAGGDFVVYSCNGEPQSYGKRQIKEDNLSIETVIPYAANSLVCFNNGPRSIHGVTRRKVTDKPRLLVNIIAERGFNA